MGKSTAAAFFSQHGARVMDTDEIARELVQPSQPALAEIKKEFGGKIISSTGELKRSELAQIIFADNSARKKLEAILHPRIRERWQSQVETWRKENCPPPLSSFRFCSRLLRKVISKKSSASPVPPPRSMNVLPRAAGRRNKSGSASPRNCPSNKKLRAPISSSGRKENWRRTRSRLSAF